MINLAIYFPSAYFHSVITLYLNDTRYTISLHPINLLSLSREMVPTIPCCSITTNSIMSFLIKSKTSKVQLGMYNFTNAVEQLTQVIEMDVIPVWQKHHSQ